ncbi:nucleotidyl transferase AbiEii/AbiGii toxin family protein [Actinoplanes derwentensis]|uniref:Nucleotidyl transferase AbiEii toxin, Type IV TA system n=1 Tax=Actinoplanes derwentensis TaxID=113562 RepID=A0A1H2D0J5_9ACTN|nr:nucleotidyl transferase AbiEii/AbiGii toxin family protein [Actinoplanes derwentensis]SDT76213.1 Nucleotidyl transferase AbiEii toxin, Type IV TA system [Actinoplanes derwentensis]
MLQRRLSQAASARGSTAKRLQSLVGNVVLCQMLPASAVKGGTGLKLRLGDSRTRATPDLDTAFRGDHDEFERELRSNLINGWGNFTGSVIRGPKRPPVGVPDSYVMQPLIVKLQFHGKSFITIDAEVGYDELEATNEPPELELSPEVSGLFVELGLPAPVPVPVLPLHHQISQKIHACTEPGNERAHDLVDLQIITPLADTKLAAATVERIFQFRAQHEWPARVTPTQNWSSLYANAADGLDVLATVEEALSWVNDEYIPSLISATE